MTPSETLNKGDVITIIGISDWMAHTVKNEVKACGFLSSGKEVFTENKKGARKKFTLRFLLHAAADDQLIFRNTFPFKIAGEISRQSTNGFTSTKISGNACINIYGTPEDIREHISRYNMNQNFNAFDRVFCTTEDSDEFDTPVYPEAPTTSALIQGRREAITHSHHG
jgi:hypothetical protein